MSCQHCKGTVHETGCARGLCRTCYANIEIREQYAIGQKKCGRMVSDEVDKRDMTPEQLQWEQNEVDRLMRENGPTMTETSSDRRKSLKNYGSEWICPFVQVFRKGMVQHKYMG